MNQIHENQMKKKSSKSRKTVNLLKIIVFAILACIIGFYVILAIINLAKNPTSTVAIKEGTISKEETDIGYLIRDEIIVKGENYKNGMEQIIDEGQKVAKEESIFRYYSNSEEDLKNKIAELDKKIEEAMKNSTDDLFSTDTKLLETQIEEELIKVNTYNSMQSIQESKKTILNYVTKKAQIAGELSPNGSYLKELINQRNECQSELRANSEYINAPESGILSYRIDDLENVLTTADFSKYNKEFLDGLNLKTGQIIPTNNEQGKIVKNDNAYIVFTSKTEQAKSAEIGDDIKIVLPNSKTVEAEIKNIIKENEDEVTIVIGFNEGINETLSYRKISFEIIWWNAKGYKVPNSAIITENNLNYVIKTRSGYLTKVLVKVKKTTDLYSIVTNYTSSEIEELSIDPQAQTSISLYDEILLKPTENDINSTV